MSDNIEIGVTVPLRPAVVVDRSGTVITGSTTLTVELERGADGYFWDWNDSTFKASGWTTKAGALAAVSDANAPGWYQRVGGWNSTAQSAGFYWVTYRDTASAAGNMPQSEEIRMGGPAGTVTTNLDVVVSTRAATGAEMALVDGAITAAKIATGAIDADALAADAVAEIQAGLATPTNITAGTITTVGTVNALAADAITSATIAAGAIGASEAPLLGTISTATEKTNDALYNAKDIAANGLITQRADDGVTAAYQAMGTDVNGNAVTILPGTVARTTALTAV